MNSLLRPFLPGAAGLAAAVMLGFSRPGAPAGETAPPAGRSTVVVATNLWQTNSLGMPFKKIPELNIRVCAWETRVRDYEVFVAETGRAWSKPSFAQGPTHPAVLVNWEDAQAFCAWLTTRERQAGRLAPGARYRLLTDQEWSAAAGQAPEAGRTPENRMKSFAAWPWGTHWPPLPGAGNYAPELKTDPFEFTAPVGSGKPNGYGLYDLGGNVWEWCEDWYNDAHVTKVLRGGSFNDSHPGTLLTVYRFNGTMNLSNDDMGFRVALAPEK
jgi:formylglycine-generating enzyme required for sulfatase activity